MTVFIAELGDKTQLATMLFAADKDVNKWLVFSAASLALVMSAAIGVLAGGLVSQFISDRILSLIAGVGFVGIGCYFLYQAASGIFLSNDCVDPDSTQSCGACPYGVPCYKSTLAMTGVGGIVGMLVGVLSELARDSSL